MASKTEKTKQARIRIEKNRLAKLYADISKERKSIVEGLIIRAAFMRATLEDMEADLDENGFVEFFTQSEKTDPYERERPVARLYNTMNKNYQSIIKQLTDLVPKEEAAKKEVDDGFDGFVAARNG
jgi:hypothetical protein